MSSQNFYETEAKRILGVPPPKILTYSYSIIVICIGIALLVSYILPITITHKFPASIDFRVIPSENAMYNMNVSQLRGSLLADDTTLYKEAHPSIVRQLSHNNELVMVTATIEREGVGETAPMPGDTLLFSQLPYTLVVPVVVQEVKLNSNGTYLSSTGKGVIKASEVIIQKDYYIAEIVQRKTNYLFYLLNL